VPDFHVGLGLICFALSISINALSFSFPRTLLRGHHDIKLTANWCIAVCRSKNAASFSSARTMKRFP
jgi:hypothetical protein